jgi:hypothetical protein
MAFSGSFMCTSFKKELLTATHNFAASGGHTFKISLYDNTATLDATTTAYTTSGELAAAGGYSTGGKVLASNIDPATGGTTAFTSWTTNPSWTSATFTSYGALIYNSSQSNKAVAVLDFGGAKTVSSGTFTIVLPSNDSSNAILRIA